MKKFYDRQKRRLIQIEQSATPEFWDKNWDTLNLRAEIESGKNDRFVLRTLNKHVSNKKGRILDGGCGIGQIVYCMHVHGYESVGIDFAKKTIERIKNVAPELNVKVGDLRDLPFPDNYFIGYWSLGVIEHFWDGYHDILKEMRRVTINGGHIFLTFPYMSPLRRLKAKLGLYDEFNGEERANFYEFALDAERVKRDFEAIGFKLLYKKVITGLKGFKDEVGMFRPLLQKLFDYKGKSLWIKGLKHVLNTSLAIFAGHQIFFVLKNVKRD